MQKSHSYITIGFWIRFVSPLHNCIYLQRTPHKPYEKWLLVEWTETKHKCSEWRADKKPSWIRIMEMYSFRDIEVKSSIIQFIKHKHCLYVSVRASVFAVYVYVCLWLYVYVCMRLCFFLGWGNALCIGGTVCRTVMDGPSQTVTSSSLAFCCSRGTAAKFSHCLWQGIDFIHRCTSS